MVLRVTISDAPHLKEAIQAVPMPESKNIVVIWCPEYFAVLSALQHPPRPAGENPTTLLKLLPQSFLTYECTDHLFNAIVRIDDLEHVFSSARNLDAVVFSQSREVCNGLNDLGFLLAQFQRPLVQDSVGGDQPSSDVVSSGRMAMQIYGKFTEGEVKLAGACHDPSQNPLPPVATFLPPAFGRVMSALKAKGMPAVAIAVHKKEAFFSAAEGEVRFELSLTAENGLKWTRGDVGRSPVRFEFPMANLDVEPGSKLSAEVSLYKRSEKVRLIWFKLDTDVTSLSGDIIHYFH
ncbi:unnamed protein product [Cuscuta campestris]|uniref:Uncharacterized protein n=1 Tax=Cuscuta campestris TaxID=132261 RepID=A0A484M676_9ASTE|nr:unnamed protein product [Cuscuta campestris]